MPFSIKDLYVNRENKEILHGVNLEVKKGEVHVIMGPNGSGKSTLVNAVMGHPKYDVISGKVFVDDEDITDLDVHKKSLAGLFLSQQHPSELNGVTITTFLRAAVEAHTGEKQHPVIFFKQLQEKMKELHIDPTFVQRYVNVGFSGGEKKKMEILQLSVLQPKYAILDETDSGLDVDALRVVSDGINKFRSQDTGVLLITHYNRLLEYVVPDFVHIMVDGKIVKSGDATLAYEIEKDGYTTFVV